MLRKGQWKLNYYHGYTTSQLFNLEDDPDEMRDRASDADCADVRAELMEIVRTHWSGDMVEEAVQRNVAYTDQIRKWRTNRPFTSHPRWGKFPIPLGEAGYVMISDTKLADLDAIAGEYRDCAAYK